MIIVELVDNRSSDCIGGGNVNVYKDNDSYLPGYDDILKL